MPLNSAVPCSLLQHGTNDLLKMVERENGSCLLSRVDLPLDPYSFILLFLLQSEIKTSLSVCSE